MAPGIGKGRTITCNFCGESGLRWDRAFLEVSKSASNPNGVARLWNPATQEIHACEPWFKKLSRHIDGFKPVNKPAFDDYLPEVPETDSASNGHYPVPEYVENPATAAMQTAIRQAGISREEIRKMFADNEAEMVGLLEAGDRKNRERIDIVQSVILNELATLETKIQDTRKLELVQPTGPNQIIDRQHKLFPDLLEYINLRFNVLMVGPAGSGKTTAAEKAAEALGLAFYLQPMGPAVTESRLLGWMDAKGDLVRTLFREAYEHGGVFMADEMDNCNASALTTLNGALANGVVGFPDGMVKRHPDFVFVGGANTYGRGADRMYVGRQQLDGATLDRFLVLDLDYDEDFERYLAGDDQKDWVLFVQKIRRIAQAHKLRVLVTPRASIDGARMLRHGIKRERVEQVRLWAAMPADAVETIRQGLY